MAWADNTAPTKPQADATTFDTSRTDHNGLLIFIFKNIKNLNSVLYLESVIRPASKLHNTGLLIKRKVLDIHLNRQLFILNFMNIL